VVLAPDACMQASDASSRFACFLARCRVVVYYTVTTEQEGRWRSSGRRGSAYRREWPSQAPPRAWARRAGGRRVHPSLTSRRERRVSWWPEVTAAQVPPCSSTRNRILGPSRDATSERSCSASPAVARRSERPGLRLKCSGAGDNLHDHSHEVGDSKSGTAGCSEPVPISHDAGDPAQFRSMGEWSLVQRDRSAAGDDAGHAPSTQRARRRAAMRGREMGPAHARCRPSRLSSDVRPRGPTGRPAKPRRRTIGPGGRRGDTSPGAEPGQSGALKAGLKGQEDRVGPIRLVHLRGFRALPVVRAHSCQMSRHESTEKCARPGVRF
jgi:hypothetical protein